MMQAIMGQQSQVQCPICQAKLLQREINEHIDMMHAHAFSPPVQASPKRQRTSRDSADGNESAASSLGRSGAGPSGAATIDLVPQVTVGEANRGQQPLPDTCEETAVIADTCPPTLVNADTCAETLVNSDTCMETRGDTPVNSGSDQLSTQVDGGATALPPAPAASSSDLILSLQPEEHLMAYLLGSRTHALRCVRDNSVRKHAKVAELCGEVQQDIEQRRQDFAWYPVMAKPTDHDQQCARNAMRGELENVSQKVQGHLTSLMGASSEPEEACRAAEAAQLEKIHSVMNMLQKHLEETQEEFQKCREEEAAKREASEAAALALEPSLDCLDNFVCQVAQEVDEETTKAIKVCTEKLEDLQAEQTRFVNANDSPQRNPIFAKVIEDLDSTKRVLEEHCGQSAAYKGLLKNWDAAFEKMPKQRQPLPPTPEKRSLMDRVLGRS